MRPQTGSGSTRNTGVLGAMVFGEKRKAYVPTYHQYGQLGGYALGGQMMNMAPMPTTYNCVGGSGMATGATADSFAGTSVSDCFVGATRSLNNITATSASSTYGATASIGSAATLTASNPRGQSRTKGILRAAPTPGSSAPEALAPAPVEQTLGTGFGSAQDFGTTAVEFDRGDLNAMIVLYYDDSRGLRARGIEMVRPSKQRVQASAAPQAFPGMSKGCTPPKGWSAA